MKDLVKSHLLVFISTLLLGTGFLHNQFKVADQAWFQNHQQDTESLVIGRMVKARRDGIFSFGGLTGQVTGIQQLTTHDTLKWSGEAVSSQYQAYYHGLDFTSFNPYFSQIGFQAISFCLIEKLIPLSPQRYIMLLKFLNAYSFAFVLSLIILWFYVEFGLFSALLVMLTTMFSQWMTVFGRNLWWVMWAFYLPCLVSLHHLRQKTSTNIALIFIYVTVFIKCLYNGYEYITTTLLMMVTPYIYYWWIEGWNFKSLVQKLLVVGTTALVSILSTTIILAVQISSVKGGLNTGLHHIFIYSVGKRTYGDAGNYPKVYADSLKADVVTVVNKYLDGFIFDFHQILGGASQHLNVKYQAVIVVFACVSCLVWLCHFLFQRRKLPLAEESLRKLIGLSITVWFSFLAPLSWMMIFKGHSYIHTHMNFITWHMPFTLLGFGLLGAFLSVLATTIYNLRHNR